MNYLNKNEKIYDDSYDFTGCRVVIPMEDMGISSHDSTIIEHDRQAHTIKIRTVGENNLNQMTHISVLIFVDDNILHFMGTVHKNPSPLVYDIAIYNGKRKEDRRHPRFDISSRGVVETLCISQQYIKLRMPLSVDVINISNCGALVRTLPNAFFKNHVFSLDLELNGSLMNFMCLVVRVNEIDDKTSNYGCEFIPIAHKTYNIGGIINASK